MSSSLKYRITETGISLPGPPFSAIIELMVEKRKFVSFVMQGTNNYSLLVQGKNSFPCYFLILPVTLSARLYYTLLSPTTFITR